MRSLQEHPQNLSRSRRWSTRRTAITGLLAVLAAMVVVGCRAEASHPGQVVAGGAPELRPAQCEGSGNRAECFWATVPENRQAPDGRQIDLWVVVLRAKVDNSSEPVLFFPGGPGQATTDLIPLSQGLFGSALEARDAVFIGQRGTGRSHPLNCSGNPDRDASQFFRDIFDPESIRECYQSHLARADPDHYRVENYVADIHQVLDWLGYDRVLLWGGSGGTRTAQAFLRAHPERVVATALVGVAPLDLSLPLHMAGFVDRAWRRVVADCVAEPKCAAAYPELEADMAKIRRQFDGGPVTAEVVDQAGKRVRVEMSSGVFAYAVRGMLYANQGVTQLPKLVAAAAESGDLSAFAQAHYQRSKALLNGNVLAMGVHLSTYCAEDLPREGTRKIAESEVEERTAGTLLGRFLYDQYSAACSAWPVAPAPIEESTPAAADSPVLLISGRYDPSTPDAAAERVKAHLPNHRHIVVRDRGHDAGFGCAAQAISNFLRDGSFETFENPCDNAPARFVIQ